MNISSCFILLSIWLTAACLANAQTTPQATPADAGSPAPEVIAGTDANYTVVPRKPELTFYPCSLCHKFLPTNAEQRELIAPHPSTLEHSNGRFWCLTCHNQDDRDYLRRVDGALLDFDNAPELCASCHMARYRDWKGGAHGKRIETWEGERVIASCTQCHDPHSPTIKPRAPQAPPPVRLDLSRPQLDEHGAVPVWERTDEDHE